MNYQTFCERYNCVSDSPIEDAIANGAYELFGFGERDRAMDKILIDILTKEIDKNREL